MKIDNFIVEKEKFEDINFLNNLSENVRVLLKKGSWICIKKKEYYLIISDVKTVFLTNKNGKVLDIKELKHNYGSVLINGKFY